MFAVNDLTCLLYDLGPVLLDLKALPKLRINFSASAVLLACCFSSNVKLRNSSCNEEAATLVKYPEVAKRFKLPAFWIKVFPKSIFSLDAFVVHPT